MKMPELSALLDELLARDVRFLVVGGLAVVVHGYTRVTHDLDLVLAMDQDNVHRALCLLKEKGFIPRLPVPLMDFANEAIRGEWTGKRNLQVFSLHAPTPNGLVVDLFASLPFDFDVEWAERTEVAFPGVGPLVPVVRLETLLEMKRKAGRPVDLDDLKALGDLHG